MKRLVDAAPVAGALTLIVASTLWETAVSIAGGVRVLWAVARRTRGG